MASPYTYDEMKRRQKASNQANTSEPIKLASEAEPDLSDTTGVVDEGVLNAEAAAPPESTQVEQAQAEMQEAVKPQLPPSRAKRAVVLNAARNGEHGRKLFADQIRRMYKLPSTSKLTDDEVIQSAYDVQSGSEPDLTPENFEKDLHSAFGDKVDRRLLEMAHEDYPGISDEAELIERMYKAKVKNAELPPITYEDKAHIVARRYPALHKSEMDPEKALQLQYKTEKAKGKNVGSYNDWLHSQMAPTLFERSMQFGGSIAQGLLQQAKHVGTAAAEIGAPGMLARDIAAAQAGDEEAKQRLIDSGKGALIAGSFAAGPLVGQGLRAAEGAMGVSQTMPALAGALEGGTIGGAQMAGEAAIEGKPLRDVAQEGLGGAAAGIGLGSIAGAIHGHVQHVGEIKRAAQIAEEAAERVKAGSANLPPEVPPVPAAPVVTDPLELAARHQREAGWQAAIENFAKEHEMDPSSVRALVDPAEPSTTDLAAAAMRHGVSIDDINALKEVKPEHLAEPVAPAAAPAVAPEPAAPIPGQPAPERGLLQNAEVDKMTEALGRAEGQLAERNRMRRQQLSERFAQAREAYKGAGGGLAGLRAKLSAMAGEMKRPDWEGVRDLFDDIDQPKLHNAIAESSLLEGDKLTAHAGLERLLGKHRLGAPTASQIRALRLAFGDAFTDAALKGSPEMNKWMQGLLKTLNTPRTVMTSMDLSAGMRQGYLMTSQPGYWQAWKTMLKSVGDEQFATDAAQLIKDDGLYDVMRESGVYFQGPEFKAPSETFAGSWVDNAPGIKHSQRAYDSFINQTRRNVFSDVYKSAVETGVDVTDPQFRQSLAHWINTGTGRGNLAMLGRDANLLNAALFSPRLAWSRIETFNPMYYKSLHPFVRRQAWQANVKTIGSTMALLGTIAGSGLAQVAWDPRSSDFAKIRVGNTRVDMLGGHQQIGRLIAQMTTGKMISSTTGREIDLAGTDEKNGFKSGSMNRADVLARFIEAKASPLASLGLAALRGKDFLGRPISMPNEIATRLTPMPIEDIGEALKDGGLQRGALVAPLALVGIGTQTYGAQMPKAAGGEQKPDEGVAMWLWNHLNGNEENPEMEKLTPQLADQWVKDAAMAQMIAHHEATQSTGFFDKGYDQQAEIRKVTARRMARVNKLYKDLTGANGEARRLAANEELIQKRADATGVDPEALRNPEK